MHSKINWFFTHNNFAIRDIKAIVVRFVGEIIEEKISFNTKEILDVKWIDKENLKNMKETELRGYDSTLDAIKWFEEGKIYPLEIFDEKIYLR